MVDSQLERVPATPRGHLNRKAIGPGKVGMPEAVEGVSDYTRLVNVAAVGMVGNTEAGVGNNAVGHAGERWYSEFPPPLSLHLPE